MKTLLLAVLLLTGCGYDYPNKYESWSGEWIEKNDNFTVNYDPDVIEGPLLENIERAWLEVQTCVGIPTVAGLIIEYTPQSEIQQGYNGYILFREKYIRARKDDPSRDNKTLRHEFIHWILYKAGASDSDLKDHNSPFYELCDLY